jgi:hypothetical protein
MNKNISLVLIVVTVCVLAVAIWNENGPSPEKTGNDKLQSAPPPAAQQEKRKWDIEVPDFTIIDKSPENEKIVGSQYQNTKYKFRFSVPDGWDYFPPGAAHTIVKVGQKRMGISMIVSVFPYDNPDLKHFQHTQQEMDDLLSAVRPAMRSQNIEPTKVELEKTFLYNHPAYTTWVEYINKGAGIEIEYISLTTQCVMYGGLYNIIIMLPKQLWTEEMANRVMNSINSFRFDFY